QSGTTLYPSTTLFRSLSGLATSTTYFYRFVFYNSSNNSTKRGSILSFASLPTPTTTTSASTITSSSAVVGGTVNPNGSSGYVYVLWGKSSTLTGALERAGE